MNIINLLNEYNIPVAPSTHHHTRPGWVNIDCPFCSRNTRRYRLGINVRGLYSNCWSCGSHKLIKVFAELTSESYANLKKIFDELDVPTGLSVQDRKPGGKLVLPKGIQEFSPVHVNYLRKRGFNIDEVKTLWTSQGIGLVAGPLSWRIFLPIVYRGSVASWTTRSLIPDDTKRYISARPSEEAIHHKELLYGYDYVRNTVIICEGPLDVWAIGPGAVCTFGTSYTRAQLVKMAEFPKRYVCFDNSKDAQSVALRLCNELSLFPGETANIVLDEKDPADMILQDPPGLRELKRLVG